LRNKKTHEITEVFCTWSELQKMLDEDLDLVQMLTTPKIIGMQGSVISKTSNLYKDKLKEIKKKSGKNNTIKV
tara:strand:- start:65 stop:283 length:219 start_codon:yes stop_codon:yes gene_type:complete